MISIKFYMFSKKYLIFFKNISVRKFSLEVGPSENVFWTQLSQFLFQIDLRKYLKKKIYIYLICFKKF